MTRLLVSDDFYCTWKVMEAGNAALGLWARAAAWCSRYAPDGRIPVAMIRPLGGKPRHAATLVRAGLWLYEGSDYLLLERGTLWDFAPEPVSRPKIPDSLRRAVYDRDGWTCVTCGAQSDLTLDHVYPFSLGGGDTFANLQTLCRPCNSRKGARV